MAPHAVFESPVAVTRVRNGTEASPGRMVSRNLDGSADPCSRSQARLAAKTLLSKWVPRHSPAGCWNVLHVVPGASRSKSRTTDVRPRGVRVAPDRGIGTPGTIVRLRCGFVTNARAT